MVRGVRVGMANPSDRTVARRHIRRRRVAIAGVAAAAVAAVTGVVIAASGGGSDPVASDGIERLLPQKMPTGFEPFELRTVPDSSPFAGSTQVAVRVFGKADGTDPLGGGDLGVAVVRSAAVADASGFATDQTEVKLAGDRTAYRSTWNGGPSPMRLLTWYVGDDGAVALAGSRTLDDAALERLVGTLNIAPDGSPTPEQGTIPDGFAEVAAGDGSMLFTGRPPTAARGYEAEYRHATDPSRQLTVSRWRADVAWEAMFRWWLGSAGGGVEVGDHAARVFTVDGDPTVPPVVVVAWRDRGTSTLVIGSGVRRDDLVTAARSLRRADSDELARFSRPGGSGGPLVTTSPPVTVSP